MLECIIMRTKIRKKNNIVIFVIINFVFFHSEFFKYDVMLIQLCDEYKNDIFYMILNLNSKINDMNDKFIHFFIISFYFFDFIKKTKII